MSQCVFCGTKCNVNTATSRHRINQYECPYCGVYLLLKTFELYEVDLRETEIKFKIACVLNEKRLKGFGPIALVNKKDANETINGFSVIPIVDLSDEFPKKAGEYITRAILNLSQLKPPFEMIQLDMTTKSDYLHLFKKGQKAGCDFLHELESQRLIRFNQVSKGPQWNRIFLTSEAYQLVESPKCNEEKTTDTSDDPREIITMEYDVFISHASEDKKTFVEPLAIALQEEGIKVWYDEFEMKLGDSLRKKIDFGLANSRYGVVVLSKSFFSKNWPQTELDSLVTRENSEGKKVILPIWHEVTRQDVEKFSPILASKLAAKSSEPLGSIVDQIKNVLHDKPIPQKSTKNDTSTTDKHGILSSQYKAVILAAGNSKRWQRSIVRDKDEDYTDEYYWKNINKEIEKENKKQSINLDLLNKPDNDLNAHKCFAGVGEGTILGHIIKNFQKMDISDIAVITSNEADAQKTIRKYVTDISQIKYIEQHGNQEIAYTMYCALKEIYKSQRSDEKNYDGNVIISYSDIVWKPDLLKRLKKNNSEISLLVDTSWQDNYPKQRRFWHDKLCAELVFYDDNKNIKKIGEAVHRYNNLPPRSFEREDKFEEIFNKPNVGECVGLFKFSKAGAEAFIEVYESIRYKKTINIIPWEKPYIKQDSSDSKIDLWSTIEVKKLLAGCFLGYLDRNKKGGYVKAVEVDDGWSEVDCWGDVREAKRKIQLWEESHENPEKLITKCGINPEQTPKKSWPQILETLKHTDPIPQKSINNVSSKSGEEKPWYKKLWIIITGAVLFLVAFTTLIINIDKIRENHFAKEVSGKESLSLPINKGASEEKQPHEKKLKVTLKGICNDIDSRPLAQQKETAKQYYGMKIERELLRVDKIEPIHGDESIYNLSLIFPDEQNSNDSKRTILCQVHQNLYPRLQFATKETEFYVSGEFEYMWDTFEPFVSLSNVTLEFE